MLKLGVIAWVFVILENLAAGIQLLGKPFDGGESEGCRGRVVLVVVLHRQRVFHAGLKIEVRGGLIRDEIGGLRQKYVFWKIDGRSKVRVRGRDHVLAVG